MSINYLLVPSTVRPLPVFYEIQVKPLTYKYIGYFGALTFRRDNVDILIKAFAESVARSRCNYFWSLVDTALKATKNIIISLAEEMNILNKINLLDYMPREEITKYIAGSEILVMVRSKDMESQASFPSKLTEYLAASIPLITV
ncbi:MAG: glycosyltransferase [Bacteroidales bacterium]|nr:glycosyltransferase [Bacteroidales bacterium]